MHVVWNVCLHLSVFVAPLSLTDNEFRQIAHTSCCGGTGTTRFFAIRGSRGRCVRGRRTVDAAAEFWPGSPPSRTDATPELVGRDCVRSLLVVDVARALVGRDRARSLELRFGCADVLREAAPFLLRDSPLEVGMP